MAEVVDAKGQTDRVSGKHSEVLERTGSGPEEGVGVQSASLVAGKIGETRYVASLIDGSRSVPRDAPKTTQVRRDSVLPQQGMFGAESSACAIARTGDADDLAFVVDRRRRGSGIAG